MSSPIDQAGNDDGKSWQAGYKAGRNMLLTFIDLKQITNVVLLNTDEHQSRVNELWCSDAGGVRRSSCCAIVTGPVGATGPDAFTTNHSSATIAAAASTDWLLKENAALNGNQPGDQLGLQDFGARVANIKRDKDGVQSVTVSGTDWFATTRSRRRPRSPRVIMTFDVTPVPEPSGWVLMLGGGALLRLLRRRLVPAQA